MYSAVTISLVSQARGGPFVFWDDLQASCDQAARLGFDAIELFAPGPHAVDARDLQQRLSDSNLRVAAVGTGAGMVIHGLSLVDADPQRRKQAVQFVTEMIDFGASLEAPAIIGSMQGKWDSATGRDAAFGWLRDALQQLGRHAAQYGLPLIYEPLNRYETNMVNTIAEGVALLRSLSAANVKLLADLFHMNIEEIDLANAIRTGRGYIGHVHFVDSNRRPAGMGHTDFLPIAVALKEIGYDRYLSAEAFAYPDPESAARQTIETYREYFG